MKLVYTNKEQFPEREIIQLIENKQENDSGVMSKIYSKIQNDNLKSF